MFNMVRCTTMTLRRDTSISSTSCCPGTWCFTLQREQPYLKSNHSEVINEPCDFADDHALVMAWRAIIPTMRTILPKNLVSSRSKERIMFRSKLEAFYQGFLDTAKFLDVSQLFQACEFGPYWSRILDIHKRYFVL